MLLVTSWVPRAASCTLREISSVAARCCSTAEAIAAAIWLICSIVAPMPWIASTALLVVDWMAPIWPAISSVAVAVCPARFFTSVATTAKPLPASPARAASMVAFRASRFVCRAIEVMRSSTLPIFSPAAAWSRTVASVRFACSTARAAISAHCATRLAISWSDADSSSLAPAFRDSGRTRLQCATSGKAHRTGERARPVEANSMIIRRIRGDGAQGRI